MKHEDTIHLCENKIKIWYERNVSSKLLNVSNSIVDRCMELELGFPK